MSVLVKRIFGALPFLILALAVILIFFQGPAADDFVGNYLVKTKNLGGALHYFFFNKDGNGRYFSLPLFLMISSSRFLLDHYYIVPLFLFLFAYVCLFIFLDYFSVRLFQLRPVRFHLYWLTAFIMLVFLSIIPEPATFTYWMATGVTYALSFDVFLLFIISLHRLTTKPVYASKTQSYLIAAVFAVMLVGFNEVSMYFAIGLTGIVVYIRFYKDRKVDPISSSLLLIQLIAVICVYALPGTRYKAGGFIVKQSIVASFISSGYQTLQVFYHIFSSPLAWISFLLLVFSYPFLRGVSKRLPGSDRKWVTLQLAVLFLSVWFFHFLIRHWANWVVPPRASNIMVLGVFLAISAIILLNGDWIYFRIEKIHDNAKTGINITMLFIIFALLFNSFTAGLVKNLVVAPAHASVMTDRVNQIQQAKMNNQHHVHLGSYDSTMGYELQKRYGARNAHFITSKIGSPPSYIFFKYPSNQPEYEGEFCEYYGIDSLFYGNYLILKTSSELKNPINNIR